VDFAEHEDHRAIRAAVRDVCKQFDDDYWMRLDAEHTFPWEFYREMAKGGWIGIAIPEAYGGGGQGITEASLVLEEVAASGACMNGASAIHLSIFGMHPVVLHGSEELKQRVLPPVASGELHVAFGVTEPDAGLDTTSISTRAVRDGDDYVITGAKAWTTHGGEADFYKVMARTSDDGGRGISCFLVPADAPGLSADTPEDKMGLMSSVTATMLFDNVRVPAQRRLGAEGQGLAIALAGLDSGRLGIAAVATGVAQAALDVAVKYAKERESFGKPVIEHQGLAFLLADMAAAVESARATYLFAARLRDAGRPFSRQASVAKMTATDNAMKVTTDAVQVLGGAGYTKDFPVERYMRETKVMQIFEGTNQIQRMVIARHLAKD